MRIKEWKPNEGKQTIALAIKVFELLYGGARGGGKTEAGIAWLISDGYYLHPLYRALVIRKNSEDLKDWNDRAERFFAALGARKVGNPPVFIFPTGAKVITGHLKDSEAYTKYQGHEYHRELIEELTQIAHEEDYLKLIASCRSTIPELVPGIFATTNPTGRGHAWVKRRFVKGEGVPAPGVVFKDPKSGLTRVYIPATIEDNPPLVDNNPTYINFLDSLPPELCKAWRRGSWEVGMGQFFSEWREDIHVCKPFTLPSSWQRYICLDYGFHKPSAVYWNAIDPNTGKVYTYRELYVTEHTYEMLIQAIARMTPKDETIDWMVVDSAIKNRGGESGKSGYQIFEDYCEKVKWDVIIRPSVKGEGSRKNGWMIMRDYLRVRYDEFGHPTTKWQVFTSCPNLIRVMPEQMHELNNPEDLDTDGEDHAPDAQRYGFKAILDPIVDNRPKRQRILSTKGFTHEELYDKIEGEAEAYKDTYV